MLWYVQTTRSGSQAPPTSRGAFPDHCFEAGPKCGEPRQTCWRLLPFNHQKPFWTNVKRVESLLETTHWFKTAWPWNHGTTPPKGPSRLRERPAWFPFCLQSHWCLGNGIDRICKNNHQTRLYGPGLWIIGTTYGLFCMRMIPSKVAIFGVICKLMQAITCYLFGSCGSPVQPGCSIGSAHAHSWSGWSGNSSCCTFVEGWDATWNEV